MPRKPRPVKPRESGTRLFTVEEIAEQTGCPAREVPERLRAAGIQPAAIRTTGGAKLYGPEAIKCLTPKEKNKHGQERR